MTTGDLQLTSAGGNIAASAAANDFTGTVSASTSGTSTISITDINDLTLGVISLGTGALGLTFGKDLLNNLGLGLEGRINTSGGDESDAKSVSERYHPWGNCWQRQ